MDKCDVCGKETNKLIDYFCDLCHDCKRVHTDTILLRRIGVLKDQRA